MYRLEQTPSGIPFKHEEIGFPDGVKDAALVTALIASEGRLWVGTGSGVYRQVSDGRWERICTRSGLPENFVNQVREGPTGRIWVGTRRGGLAELPPHAVPGQSPVTHIFTTADGLPSNDVRDILVSPDGRLWAGTTKGLAEASLETYPKLRFQAYAIENGLAEQMYTA